MACRPKWHADDHRQSREKGVQALASVRDGCTATVRQCLHVLCAGRGGIRRCRSVGADLPRIRSHTSGGCEKGERKRRNEVYVQLPHPGRHQTEDRWARVQSLGKLRAGSVGPVRQSAPDRWDRIGRGPTRQRAGGGLPGKGESGAAGPAWRKALQGKAFKAEASRTGQDFAPPGNELYDRASAEGAGRGEAGEHQLYGAAASGDLRGLLRLGRRAGVSTADGREGCQVFVQKVGELCQGCSPHAAGRPKFPLPTGLRGLAGRCAA